MNSSIRDPSCINKIIIIKMRITADLISKCAAYMNALDEFHLDLRGFKIPFLENLTATNDQFGTIDLTDNEIATLETLP